MMSTCREIRWMWLRRLQPNPVWDSLDLARLARHPLNDTSPESPPCNHHSNFSETENTFHAARHSSFLKYEVWSPVFVRRPVGRARRLLDAFPQTHKHVGSFTIADATPSLLKVPLKFFYRSSKAVGAGSHGPCTLLVMKNGPTRNPGPRGPQRSGGTDVRNVCVPFPATLSLFASDSSISIKCFGDRN